jgi:type II secretory pathway pseudopilin PulG
MAREKRFSIRDLLALITIMAVLFAVGVPTLLKMRARSRRVQCSNNFKVVMLAMHNYHSAYKQLPAAMGGTAGNANRLSGLIALTPFCEGQPLWEEIANPWSTRRVSYPPMGPVPWDKNYPPWQARFDYFLCPTDGDKAANPNSPFGRTNTVFCVGDSVLDIHKPKTKAGVRGMFSPRHSTRFRDILDGLSNTIAIAEIATARGNHVAGQFVIDMPKPILASPQACLKTVDSRRSDEYSAKFKLSDLGRGGNWADGAAGYSLMQTILPPNSPSCAVGGTVAVDGIYSAASRHPGGVHIGIADGSVIFITDSIESGDPTATPPTNAGPKESPYGLWGALGTRAGMERIDRDFGR